MLLSTFVEVHVFAKLCNISRRVFAILFVQYHIHNTLLADNAVEKSCALHAPWTACHGHVSGSKATSSNIDFIFLNKAMIDHKY